MIDKALSPTLMIMTLAALSAGCGDDESSTPDETAGTDAQAFVGTWEYQSGSRFEGSCPGDPPFVQDLANVPPEGKPARYSLTLVGDEILHEVDELGCEYDWSVDGNRADASGQSCDKFPDGMGGTFTLTSSRANKTLEGDSIVTDVEATFADGACSATVQGSSRRVSD